MDVWPIDRERKERNELVENEFIHEGIEIDIMYDKRMNGIVH